jgi:lipopolysaccharide export system permease protein
MLFNILKYQNLIVSRYLLRNLIVFFIAITFIITLVVFGNQFVLTVQESIERGIPIQELMPLVGFNMLRDIPIILTLSLFLSIIITISQLYKSSEAIVMNAIGLSDKGFINIIQPLIIFFFFFISFLTIYAVPWANYQKNIIQEETKNASEFSFITVGQFEEFKGGEIVFFASESNSQEKNNEQNMEEIFIYAFDNNKPVIVLASSATKYINSENNSVYLRLKNGVRYHGIPGEANINILDFDLYDLEIVSGNSQKSILSISEIEEKTTIDLIKDGGLLAKAELHWRISQPISILILAIFGVFLGKSSPRTGKGINLIFGLIIFMLYNNGLLVAKSSIESGQLNPIIGMFGIHLFLILFLIIFYNFREGKITHFVDKIISFVNKEKSHV